MDEMRVPRANLPDPIYRENRRYDYNKEQAYVTIQCGIFNKKYEVPEDVADHIEYLYRWINEKDDKLERVFNERDANFRDWYKVDSNFENLSGWAITFMNNIKGYLDSYYATKEDFINEVNRFDDLLKRHNIH